MYTVLWEGRKIYFTPNLNNPSQKTYITQFIEEYEGQRKKFIKFLLESDIKVLEKDTEKLWKEYVSDFIIIKQISQDILEKLENINFKKV